MSEVWISEPYMFGETDKDDEMRSVKKEKSGRKEELDDIAKMLWKSVPPRVVKIKEGEVVELDEKLLARRKNGRIELIVL